MKETTLPKDKLDSAEAQSPVAGPTLAEQSAEPLPDQSRRGTADPDEDAVAPRVPTPLPPVGH